MEDKIKMEAKIKIYSKKNMIKDIVLLIERYVMIDRVKRCNRNYDDMFYVSSQDFPVYAISDIGLNNRIWDSDVERWTWRRIYNVILRKHRGYFLPKNY